MVFKYSKSNNTFKNLSPSVVITHHRKIETLSYDSTKETLPNFFMHCPHVTLTSAGKVPVGIFFPAQRHKPNQHRRKPSSVYWQSMSNTNVVENQLLHYVNSLCGAFLRQNQQEWITALEEMLLSCHEPLLYLLNCFENCHCCLLQ